MRIEKDQDIAALLHHTQTIAMLGASAKPNRPSYRVLAFLLEHGFQVFPVNPGLAGKTILGQPVIASLEELKSPVDVVEVFRNAEFLPEIVDQVMAHGAKTLWTQLGVVHPTAIQTALDRGLDVVVDKCPAIEIPRLRALGHSS
ncbi:CoA-binding protein [Alphaproteobacteria bacterium]|nr:CoA-binding protein [Alphaproteobacteria bacterium]